MTRYWWGYKVGKQIKGWFIRKAFANAMAESKFGKLIRKIDGQKKYVVLKDYSEEMK